MNDIDNFLNELQSFLDTRHAAIFFGDMHGEVWINGERAGALTHAEGDARLEIHECDC